MSANRLVEQPSRSTSERRRTMLVPVAYSESVMPALRLARSSRIARRIAKWLFAGLLSAIVLMAYAPWQQSVSGTGSVLAYAPDQRPQVIEAPIKGRIDQWGEGIVENARVVQGQVIAEIRDLDPDYAETLKQQLTISKQAVEAAQQQLEGEKGLLAAAETVVETYTAQVLTYERMKGEIAAAQDAYVEMAKKKVLAAEEQLAEYRAAVFQLKELVERVRKLEQAGNLALQKVQEAERKFDEQNAKVRKAEADVDAAKADLEGKTRDREAKVEQAQVYIDEAEAKLRKSRAEVNKAKSMVAKAEKNLNEAQDKVLSAQVKVNRQQAQVVHAPFDGIVVQINPNTMTAMLKEGDPICTIVPETTDRSVQIWLDGNDAPLVEPGRHVRLQFEGWPAVQFSGWPSVAVGTFGGEVVSVDATDNGKGKFRVLVRPDSESTEWPDERFLRQGVRANGWVLLKQVPLWFEVWRQLNGFPPVVEFDEKSDKGSKSKPPKLPK